jgi:hypothetical protein
LRDCLGFLWFTKHLQVPCLCWIHSAHVPSLYVILRCVRDKGCDVIQGFISSSGCWTNINSVLYCETMFSQVWVALLLTDSNRLECCANQYLRHTKAMARSLNISILKSTRTVEGLLRLDENYMCFNKNYMLIVNRRPIHDESLPDPSYSQLFYVTSWLTIFVYDSHAVAWKPPWTNVAFSCYQKES